MFWRPASTMGPANQLSVPPTARLAKDTTTIVRWSGGKAKTGHVPYYTLSLEDAWPLLVHCRTHERGHGACQFWGAAALVALQLVADGRLEPTLTARGYDAWKTTDPGPRQEQLDALLAAIPPEAHASAYSSLGAGPVMSDPGHLLSAFRDAMADLLPRSPGAAVVTGQAAFADRAPQHVPHLRLASPRMAGQPALGVRLSLRLELDADTVTGVRAVVQAHDTVSGHRVTDAGPLWRAAPAPKTPDAARQMESLVALRRAARAWPPLARLLEDPSRPGALDLDESEIDDLLGDAVARLARVDCAVHWPRDLVRELAGRTVIAPRPAAVAPSRLLGADQLLEFQWRAALGDEDLTDAELDRLAEAHRPFVRLRDRWVRVDAALLRRVRERHLGQATAPEALVCALAGSAPIGIGDGCVEVHPTGWLADLRTALTSAAHTEVAVPAALKAELRHYQRRGLTWLHHLTTGPIGGGILADDMGLGKTIMLIALHLLNQEDADSAGPMLVVCPATMLGAWEREIARFAPTVAVRRFHGPARTLDTLPAGAVVLTTYATLRRSTDRLTGPAWSLLAADEAQAVKNALSGTAAALRKVPSRSRVALTGTPMENSLADLWALLDWVTSGLLGPWPAFRQRFARPIEAGRDTAAAARLAALISPLVLRRKKTDPGIAPELPPKTDTDEFVPLSREQASLYEAVTREALDQIRATDGINRRGLVLKLLTSLRQICNHPAQYLRESAPTVAGRSGKLDLLDTLLDQILAEGQAGLVFSQFTQMLDLLAAHLHRRGIPHQVLTGHTPTAKRDQLVEGFQNGDFPVFLLSLRAAGSGLTLTRAEHVFQIDQWWNPAVMDQAADRAYRIGQRRPVQIHRFVADGTVEEKVLQFLAAKRETADMVLGAEQLGLTELGDDQLADLVALRRH
ncbi:DEAD/DEAH box helicase [Streptomyces sp. S1D4-20]|uniref:DEAD/DEAH box helicase n=1 Tax=Streptomyces sp. S1D4-20 TaxID=2594462 RepID=UPI0011641A40|nr:DEAD/DEAH box helicase [Streptomyces sp. S1D4-20]QDN54168.1 DEAD/DEAH box helicase [Streptomyces sp. S1D4-20]